MTVFLLKVHVTANEEKPFEPLKEVFVDTAVHSVIFQVLAQRSLLLPAQCRSSSFECRVRTCNQESVNLVCMIHKQNYAQPVLLMMSS